MTINFKKIKNKNALMWYNNIKKVLIPRRLKEVFIFFIFLTFVFVNVSFAFADWGAASFIANIAAGAIGLAVFAISYLIGYIAGAIIALEGFLIEIALQLNTQITKTSFIQAGFNVSLAVANLIFVAGIIIIAIATMLKRESYGIKNVLWKLIVMAVLVNFSLTISGAIIEFANGLASYFLDAINPEVGPGREVTSSKWSAFSSAIAGAFAPHKFIINKPILEGNTIDQIKNLDNQQLAGIFGGSLAKILQPIFSMFFVIIFYIIMIVTLGALIVMLIVRYITVGFLLILAPLAWAMWIFQDGQRYWREWWDKFIKWTFFAPLVLFFLYLCILTLQTKTAINEGSNTFTIAGVEFNFDPNRKDALGGLEAFAGGFLGNLVAPVLQMIIAVGCFMGGLIAADKLGIKGSNKAIKLAKDVQGGMVGFVKRRAAGAVASRMAEKEPPPPTQYTGWRRILNPINRLRYGVNKLTYKAGGVAGGVAERFGYGPKLEEVAQKYGPWARARRREQIRAAKNTISDINKKLKENDKLIEETKKRFQNQIEEETKEFDEEIKTIESVIESLRRDLSLKTTDKKQAEEIQNKINSETKRVEQLKKQKEETINKIKTALAEELTNLIPKNLISRRRKLYEAIAHPEAFEFEFEGEGENKRVKEIKEKGKPDEPLTLFGSVAKSIGKTFKPPKPKKKISKKDLEEAGISEEIIKEIAEKMNIEVEIEKPEVKLQPPSPPKPKSPQQNK